MKFFLLLSVLLCSVSTGYAQQIPQKFSYQAVAVDASGIELKNTSLCIRATIIRGSINGTQDWVEIHDGLQTDDFGLFVIDIGDGTPISGAAPSFDAIDWGLGKFYLKVEMTLDPSCSNFILVGTNQLLSVPYALYAERAGVANVANFADSSNVAVNAHYAYYSDSSSVSNNAYYATYSDTTLVAMTSITNINDADADPTNELQNLVLNGNSLSLSGSTAPPINLPNLIATFDPDADPTNELQNLQLNGTMLSISGSSAPAINLNSGDGDTDATNELQNLVLNGNSLSLSGSTSPPINLPTLITTFDPDHDPTNELQNLTLNGSTLVLSGSTSPPIDLTTVINTFDPDHDPTNELQNLTLSGNSLSLSGSSAPPINLPNLITTFDPDHDPTNELQDLSLNGSTLTLSGSSTTIDVSNFNTFDPDHDPTNELQDLSLNGSTLILSGSSTTIDVNNFNTFDPDHDPTNELQDLSLNGSQLSISGSSAPAIDLNSSDPDHDPTNELQQLTFDSTTSILGLSNSNVHINLSTLSNFNASGSDLDYPQGVANATYLFVPDQITVPADSVLYIVASEDEMILPGYGSYFGRALTGPNLPVFKSGTKIDNCRCIGFYKEIDPFFEPVIVVLKENQGTFYQVPFGKNFVIKSGLDQSTPITLNGFTISPFSSIIKALVIPEGIQVKNLGNDEIILTGYLLDK